MAEQQPEPKSQDKLSKSLADLRLFWERLPKGIRVLVVVVGVLSVAGGVALTLMEQREEKVLFTGLSQEDASSIVAKLKEKKVEYRIASDGGTILVPAEQVHELRLELAGEGLPMGGGVGFELFDEQRFGMTQFEERMALRRALEGELSRTIGRLDAVKSARVHLVLPQKSLFGRKSMPAQGSVTLALQPKRVLSEETTQAITHLVSSSVEGLSPDQVTIVDTRGRLLSSEHGEGLNARGMQYQREYEQTMEVRLREMLDQILGPGASVVRVAAQFDFSNRETREEHYDPERSVLRSEQRETESSGAANNGAGGTPGTRSNLPGGAQPHATTGIANTKREMETRNYEVDKVVNHTVGSGAKLIRLSAAVMVNGTNEPGKPFAARPAGELRKIETAVRNALGYDETRGDRIAVQSVPFHTPEEIETPEIPGPPWWKELIPLAAGLGVAVFLLIIILSFRKKKAEEVVPVNALPLPRRVQELETMISEPTAAPALTGADAEAAALEEAQKQTTAALMGEVQKVFMNESENASKVLRTWLQDAVKASKEEVSKEAP